MRNPVKRLYIHIPFCQTKCSYCAFYSVPNPPPKLVEAFTDKIRKDIEEKSPLAEELESIYIGGGTPSLMPERLLETIFKTIFANFAVAKTAEISVECNPESITRNKIRTIANFANRISLGIQSFSEKHREKIGRIGRTDAIIEAVKLIRENGILNLACDLICSIPGQSSEEWLSELAKAIDISPQHISTYALTYEEGSRLAPELATYSPDEEAENWLESEKFLMSRGYHRYEISNYARPGMECRHNLGIWFGDRFLGLGPAAASFIGETRHVEVADIYEWLDGKTPEPDIVPPKTRGAEILAMGLRTSQGWNKARFEMASPVPLYFFSETLKELEDADLIQETNETIACTNRGLMLWNEIAEKLLR